MTADATIDAFVDAGLDCYEADLLPDALVELDIRLQIAGCGPLLEQLMALEFTDRDKRDPKPVPTPKPPRPAPPPPPPPPPKGST